MNDWKDLFDLGKAKAAAIFATIGLVIGLGMLISPAVGTCILAGAVAGPWVLGNLIRKRNGSPADTFAGASELTYRARLEVADLAHALPEYREAAGYLELADEAMRRAASTSPTPID